MRNAFFCLVALLGGNALAGEVSDSISHRDKIYQLAAAGKIVLAVGYPGLVLRSENGGESWHLIDTGSRDAFFAVKLLADGRGLIVGRSGLVLSTADGGLSWQAQKSGVEEHLFAVELLPSGHAWAVGGFGAIIHSPDGGQSWERQSYDAAPPAGCVLSDAERENEGAAEEARLNAVAFADERRGWIVGEFGLVLHTEDGGANWHRQASASGMLLFGLHLFNDRNLLVSGAEGTLMESKDGGVGWQLVEGESKKHFFMPVPRGEDVFLPSQDGSIFVRRGDGTWKEIDTGVPAWLNSLIFLDDGVSLAAGGRGHMFISRDGWKSWQKITGR